MVNIEGLVNTCTKSEGFFFKFISANDVGATGAHQAGFYMPIDIWPLFFDKPGRKGENRDKYIRVHWDNSFVTESRFIWYGKRTRSEYRLTRGFTFLTDENVGDILILAKLDQENFAGFMLSADDLIEDFFSSFNLSPADAYKLQVYPTPIEKTLEEMFWEWLQTVRTFFPDSSIISSKAREFWMTWSKKTDVKEPDKVILDWIKTEYELFKYIEKDRYGKKIEKPFRTVDELIEFANSILNRRKSRAGRSLENHLSYLFKSWSIPFSQGMITEGNKRPDFIFPSIQRYHDLKYPDEKLRFLGAKTTCKDRWRQILNEADRIPSKHLFTLQQGISKNQLREMEAARVILVVPEDNKKAFPKEFRNKIQNMQTFLSSLKEYYL